MLGMWRTPSRWFSNNFLKDLLTKQKLAALNSQKPASAKKSSEQLSSRKVHKKKMDKEQEDIDYEEFPNMQKEVSEKLSSYLQNQHAQREYLTSAQREKTQRLLRSLKSNTLDKLAKERGQRSLSADYNNYEKYYRNYTEFSSTPNYEADDDGEVITNERINRYMLKHAPEEMENTPIGEARAEEEEEGRVSKRTIDEANKYLKHGEEEPEEEEDSRHIEERGPGYLFDYVTHGGRVSPVLKEELFKLWSEGWNVEDLSLRYGILPNRVKAIIWLKRYFYEEVMPNVDSITWKLALEREYVDASIFPFVDYGLDLRDLAVLEQGTMNVRLTRTHIDINPPPEIAQKIQDRLDELPKPYYSYIDRHTYGSSYKKYKIKDMVVFKGNGRVSVSEMFKKVCFWSDSKRHWLPKQVAEKVPLGPRIASKGYRISTKYVLK